MVSLGLSLVEDLGLWLVFIQGLMLLFLMLELFRNQEFRDTDSVIRTLPGVPQRSGTLSALPCPGTINGAHLLVGH